MNEHKADCICAYCEQVRSEQQLAGVVQLVRLVRDMRKALQKASAFVDKELLAGADEFLKDKSSKPLITFVRPPDDEGVAPLHRRDGKTSPTKRGTDGLGSTGR